MEAGFDAQREAQPKATEFTCGCGKAGKWAVSRWEGPSIAMGACRAIRFQRYRGTRPQFFNSTPIALM